jgi:hypothetical protein
MNKYSRGMQNRPMSVTQLQIFRVFTEVLWANGCACLCAAAPEHTTDSAKLEAAIISLFFFRS